MSFKVLRQTRSIFIPNLISSFDNSTHFYIVKEFIPGGDLFYHLNHFKKDKGSDENLKNMFKKFTFPKIDFKNIRLGRFTADEVRFYAVQIIMVLEFLHAKSVIYRNLTLENIMITSNGHIKLVDFSCAKVKSWLYWYLIWNQLWNKKK